MARHHPVGSSAARAGVALGALPLVAIGAGSAVMGGADDAAVTPTGIAHPGPPAAALPAALPVARPVLPPGPVTIIDLAATGDTPDATAATPGGDSPRTAPARAGGSDTGGSDTGGSDTGGDATAHAVAGGDSTSAAPIAPTGGGSGGGGFQSGAPTGGGAQDSGPGPGDSHAGGSSGSGGLLHDAVSSVPSLLSFG